MRPLISITIFSLVYAIIRYVAFDPKNAEHIPVFVLNKAISMAAALALVGAIWCRCRGKMEEAGDYFRYTMFAVLMHIPMSLLVLRPGYFPEFFLPDGQTLKLLAELVVFFGALGVATLWLTSYGQLAPGTRNRMGIVLTAVLVGRKRHTYDRLDVEVGR